MRAALFYGSHQLLKLEDVAEPVPQRGEVLVKVTACGVCHTDLHYTDHDVPTFMKPPVILGHEVSGIIEEIGEGVKQFKKGDRVLVPPVFTCGECEMCRTGRENVCAHMKMLGNHMNGAYAEYVVAPAKDTIALPDSIPLPLTATQIRASISISSLAAPGCRPTRFRRINHAGGASTSASTATPRCCDSWRH